MIINLFKSIGLSSGPPCASSGGIPVIDFHFADLFGGRFYLLGALQIVFEQFPIDLRFIRHRDAVRQGRPATEAMSSFFESTHFEATA